ncbi:regulatory protein GemA [Paracoccus pantotrophus]|uniref:regulatory protein GemA n=1 Tax=Paracoccus pantotrophus TaxID=82367 RepID=UPI00048D1BF4|nr:regulatory protein GemA [Paracoccus pantotrophus]
MNSIAIINIAKGQLGLHEDDYRAMLVRVTGKASLRQMSERQKIAVIDELKRLGFRVRSGGKALPVAHKPYIRLIHALWKSCHRHGAIENGSREALRAFCKRFVAHGDDKIGVDPDLLTHDQATPIIKALREMEARAKGSSAA